MRSFGLKGLFGFLIHWALIFVFFYSIGSWIGWPIVRGFFGFLLSPFFEFMEAYDFNWREFMTHPAVVAIIILWLIKQFNRFR